jgi:hypothetical protein
VVAEVCAACGETYFDIAAMEKMEAFDQASRSATARRKLARPKVV